MKKCTCCGTEVRIRYPYRGAKLCARCLRVWIADAVRSRGRRGRT